MPKLTLQFKGKPIDVFPLVESCVTIGRDPDNTIQIDSLAIAPLHLSLEKNDAGYTVEAKTDLFPVLLNNLPPTEQTLTHGDIIGLGKHSLRFSEDVTTVMSFVEPEPIPEPAAPEQDASEKETGNHTNESAPEDNDSFAAVIPKASLQFMSGANIGRLIPLTRKMTEIKHHDLVPALIARRADGFYVSRLLDEVEITIDGQPLITENALTPGNMLKIGEQKLQFFEDSD